MEDAGTSFDPKVVSSIVKQALDDYSVLPVTFVESEMYQRLSEMLVRYMPAADVAYMIGELKEQFYSGFTRFSSQSFYSTIKACRKCGNEVSGTPELAAWNTVNPDLLIVAETPSAIQPYVKILAGHLKAAGFTSPQCCLTFLVRCPTTTHNKKVLENCIPYLYTEIAILNPKVVIPLGMPAYTALTGDDKVSLKTIRSIPKWFGTLHIIPEASYGWSYHNKEKYDNIDELYTSTFTQAHRAIYGTTDI